MDTARNGAGRLAEHANGEGPWLPPGQRSLAGPGIRDFFMLKMLVVSYVFVLSRAFN